MSQAAAAAAQGEPESSGYLLCMKEMVLSPVPAGPITWDPGSTQGHLKDQGQLATFYNYWFCAINIATLGIRVCFVRRWLFIKQVPKSMVPNSLQLPHRHLSVGSAQ